MKQNKKKIIPLDKFIDFALYNKKRGFYMKQNPFGSKGDFITAPDISIIFSEMITIWIVSFWEYLNKTKKINIIDMGGGNGEMMSRIIKTSLKFSSFNKSCNFVIFERSGYLKKIQKKKLLNYKINWTNNLKKLENVPSLFIGNEFFDSMPIKQLIKKNNIWFEKFVKLSPKNPKIIEKKISIKNYEKKVGFNFSKRQNFIEFSPLAVKIIKIISKKIKKTNGGLLIIDYGYIEEKMYNTLQAIKKHNQSSILKNIGNSDITYKINYNFIKKLAKKLKLKYNKVTTQRDFLIRLGIFERGETISKNLSFSKKANIYYRIKRLVDKNQMGELFKVMFISCDKTNFQTGFK